MPRGSLVIFRRRCGKQNCRCASGEPHESPALTYFEDGRNKTLTLSGGEVREVRDALDANAIKGLAALRKRKAAARKGGRS